MNQPLLFRRLPLSLFFPLAAPGAAFYSEVLLLVFVETQRHQEPLSRGIVMSLIMDVLEEQNALEVTAELGDEALSPDEDVYQRRASAVLRYFLRCQWLHEEIQKDFTVVYTLPDYAFRILAILHEIAHDSRPPLQGLICAIHDLLQNALSGGNEGIRVPQAHRETMRLLNGLKELQHNIGIHIEEVLRQVNPRDVLEQTFGAYLHDATRRTYHELRTTDHVSRFRPGINMALAYLGTDEHLTKIEQSAKATSTFIDTQELLEQLQTIQNYFDTLDTLLSAIDTRHRQFFDIAIRSVENKLLANSTTSGHIRAILTHLLTAQKSDYMQGEFEWSQELPIDPLISLHALSLPDHTSITSPRRPREPFTPEPEEYTPITEDEIDAARESILTQMLRSISREQVRTYAHKLLRDCEERFANDFPISGPEDLPMLMYLRAYGNGSLGYRVVNPPETDKVVINDIEFRNFLIRREGW
jgi:hypothetical protein